MRHLTPADDLALPPPASRKTALARTRALALALLLHAAGAALLWGMGLTSSPFPLPQGDAVQVALYAPANGLGDGPEKAPAGVGNEGGVGEKPAQAAESPPAPAPQTAPPPPRQARRYPPDAVPRSAARQKPPRRDRGQHGDREMTHTGGTTEKPSQAMSGAKDAGAQGSGTGGEAMHGAGAGQAPAPLAHGVNPRPRYPELARQRGQQGVVLLRVQVDARGTPTHVLIQQSSGHSLLDAAARDAVRRWRFSPALRLGRPVPGAVAVPVHFRLR